MGSHKVVGKRYVFTRTSQMASIGTIFTSTYHTKQLNPWPNSPSSRVVNYSRLTAFQGDMEPFKGNSSTHGCLTNLSNKPQQSSLGNFQHHYPLELLVNVYSYRLIVKSACLAVVCMEAGFSQIRSHIYSYVIL